MPPVWIIKVAELNTSFIDDFLVHVPHIPVSLAPLKKTKCPDARVRLFSFLLASRLLALH